MVKIKSIPEIIKEVSPHYSKKGGPDAMHTIVYDSSTETLEPIYFYVIDFMAEVGLSVEKLIDNFIPSPGSGHFGEMGQRLSVMQQQGTKLLGDINTVLRSVLNLIYDLKEFRMRLRSYADLESKEQSTREAARLSLKQIWMDKVDMSKGNSSIKAMAMGQAGFATLISAFLAVDNEKDVDKIDLNEIVKRILKPRIQEFNIWIKQSGEELKKRYKIEKAYLRSQVNSLKLYSRWAKPYLRAAQQLEMGEGGTNPALVKAFNTMILELSLLGKSKINVQQAAIQGDLPKEFRKMKFKRDYFKCILVEFVFRGIPQKVAQQSHFAFGGKAEITFKAYSLNQDEINAIKKELDNDDLGSAFSLIEGATDASLKELQDEIDFFLNEEPDKGEEETKKKSSSDVNPFSALLGLYDKEDKKDSKKKDENKKVEKDDYVEKEVIRPYVIKQAKDTAFLLFDVYKKSHGMPSYT
jgi:hypothetical protein